MKPRLIENYVASIYYTHFVSSIYEKLLSEVNWLNVTEARSECFMSAIEREYAYGTKIPRTYKSIPLHPVVEAIMWSLNSEFQTQYDVCFLNMYANEKQALGWHSDDSPEMDMEHPIAVVSFGAEREIWVKKKDYKGEVPKEDRYLLKDGSLFIMPEKFQYDNLHKIPKHDKPCGGRISLTFRKIKNGKGGITEFNCLREDELKANEYIYFGTEIEPTEDKHTAIKRVRAKIAKDGWSVPIWICGYWEDGGCYTGGKYVTLDGWERAN